MNSEFSRRQPAPGQLLSKASSLMSGSLLNNQFLIYKKHSQSSGISDIYFGIDVLSQSEVILKILKSQFSSFLNNQSIKLIHEGQIQYSLQHKNIIKILSDKFTYVEKQGKKKKEIFYLPMEYASNGDLSTIMNKIYIKKRTGLSENCCLYLFEQIIDGVNYIHSKGICHRDIKLDNILLDENLIIKITDFECADYYIKDDEIVKMKNKVGTERYMAPEMHYLRNEGTFYHGNKVDIFACGIVLIGMLTGKMYFESTTPSDYYFRMYCEDKEQFFNLISKNCSEQVMDLIKKMIEIDSNLRISAKEILKLRIMEEVDVNQGRKELDNILKTINCSVKLTS